LNSDVLEGVGILSAADACYACQQIANKVYPFEDVPEIPNENCTSMGGCRCTYIPIVKGLPNILGLTQFAWG
jgi:hypothetical protein